MSNRKAERPPTPEICPICGYDVPEGALACQECGADHNSGWRTDVDIRDAIGVDEEEFDYDEFVRNEFGSPIKPAGIKTVWWVTALCLIPATAILYFIWR
ncbi:MAG: hypothetical protein ACXW4Z_23200 [Candidatus Binatia bacterium]